MGVGDSLSKALEIICLNSKSTSIGEWGVKFSGEPNTLGVNEFIQRITELSEARGMSVEQLYNSATILFEGEALVWFRSIKGVVKDWSTLCSHLKDEFFPKDYNDKLWDLIKKRTQGESESVSLYVAYMTNFFNRLTLPVSEALKLRIIRKNYLIIRRNLF